MNLDIYQDRAARHENGPMLVLAGPGSGKTTVIVQRLEHLIYHYNVSGNKILVVTFSKAAAKEMQERFERKCPGQQVVFKTIHALCYEIICAGTKKSRLDIAGEKDLEHLIAWGHEILTQQADIRKKQQQRFDYIFVDEFQDTSLLQAQVLFLLAEPKNNLMVVGDDDQSIYGFRGATPEIFTLFTQRFPTAEIVQLQMNYRSKKEIITYAERLIGHNSHRMEKKPAICSHKGDGQGVFFLEYEEQWEQMEAIIKQMKEKHGMGIPYHQMAVIFRTKAQFREFLICGKLHGVCMHCREKKEFLNYAIYEDVLSYVRILCKVGKRKDYLQIMNKPNRGLSRQLFDTENVCEEQWLQTPPQGEGRIRSFRKDLDRLRTLPPYLGFMHLYHAFGYMDYVKAYCKENQLDVDFFVNLLQRILVIAKDVKNYRQLLEALEEKEGFASDDAVQIHTMHSAKGLEFDVVFLPDINEDILPNKKTMEEYGIEEERRLFYVAMTRAKKELYISWVRKKNNADVLPSAFLQELII